MSRGPVVLTSLEEDFREIGILRDEAKDSTPSVSENKSEEPKDEPKGEAVEGDDGGDPVDEARRTFTKVDKSAKARKSRRIARMKARRKKSAKRKAAKRWRKTARGKRWAKEYGKARGRLGGRRPKGKRMHIQLGGRKRKAEDVESLDRSMALIEETHELIADLISSDMTEAMRSFANVAIISELLSRAFSYFGEKHDDTDYDDVANLMGEMAEEAAEIAEALKDAIAESEAIDLASVTEPFESMMGVLQMALEDYADMEPELEEEDDSEDPPSEGEGE